MEFMIVDNDPITLLITQILIKNTLEHTKIKTFINPGEALLYLKNDLIHNIKPVVLFLDLNMPIISGWTFLELFSKLPDAQKTMIKIYIVSSSVDPNDRARALSNPYVTGFISKPLTKDFLIANFTSANGDFGTN
jgi:CheY-like chemotaxis protein